MFPAKKMFEVMRHLNNVSSFGEARSMTERSLREATEPLYFSPIEQYTSLVAFPIFNLHRTRLYDSAYYGFNISNLLYEPGDDVVSRDQETHSRHRTL